MSNVSIQKAAHARPSAIQTDPPAVPPTTRELRRSNPLYRPLKVIASLRLTVFLFVLSIILVFVGTLAQKDAGTMNVVNSYFWSIYVWVPFQVFARFGEVFFGLAKDTAIPGAFPFPGGKLLGAALLVNLLAAHLVRFKISWKRSGIFLIHGGLILMLVGEFITREFAVEGDMTIPTGKTVNFIELRDKCELAFISAADANTDDVTVVPDPMLRKPGVVSDPHSKLPAVVEIKEFLHNSMLTERTPANPGVRADKGIGESIFAVDAPKNVGVDVEGRIDIPSAYVTFKDKETQAPLGTYLVSIWAPHLDLPAQTLKVAGKTYEIALRFKRTYKPYAMELIKVTTTHYPGTSKASEYDSVVRLMDPGQNVYRKVQIQMNDPLRYRGETFFQKGVNGHDEETVLQVVRNPGWVLPYASCTVVALGMIIHFLLHLSSFLKRRALA